MHNPTSIEEIINQMQRQYMPVPQQKVHIAIPDAKQRLTDALAYILSFYDKHSLWLPEYDEVANWLADNKGLGLFMYGNCGRGKSILGRYVLPALLLQHHGKVASVYDMHQMNSRLDEVLKKHILSLDDVGTEEPVNVYGNKRLAFAEIVDAAEKQGKLLITSSNLDADQIARLYGDRTLDRIKAICKRIPFRGNSLRQ